jgi:hypothetical protein
MDAIVSFSMAETCHGLNHQFQHYWNVPWSKSAISACLECVVVKNVCFSIWNVSWSVSSASACLEYVWWSKLSVLARLEGLVG